jgi:hypothetical protein
MWEMELECMIKYQSQQFCKISKYCPSEIQGGGGFMQQEAFLPAQQPISIWKHAESEMTSMVADQPQSCGSKPGTARLIRMITEEPCDRFNH